MTANAMNTYEALDGSVFDYLNSNPKLRDIADVHVGIEWNISLQGNKGVLISSAPKPGFQKGLDKISGKIEPYYAQGFVYLNMDERYRRTFAHSLPWDKPKVIANRHVIGGGPWPVPFDFPDYYPEDFGPCIPLHKYLEMDLRQASAAELLKRITLFDSEDIHEFVMDIEERQS